MEKKQVKSGQPEDEAIRFQLDDANREISRLKSKVNHLVRENEGGSFTVDDQEKEIKRLKAKVQAFEESTFQ